MAQALQRTADRTEIEPGRTLQVHERFVGLTEGQEVEVVGVSGETLADGEYPARVDLQLSGYETSPFAAREESFDGLDVKRAVDRGDLELQYKLSRVDDRVRAGESLALAPLEAVAPAACLRPPPALVTGTASMTGVDATARVQWRRVLTDPND